jgi:hypothetical protein
LRGRLGLHITAYLAGATDPQQIAAYTRGADIHDLHTRRLHEGYRVVQTIEATYDTTTAKASLFGTNSRLADRAPIGVIAHATMSAQFADVRNAAHAFARQKRAER